jgi:outer membrane protein assembly factor BamA
MSKLQNNKYYTADEIDNVIKKLYSSWLFSKVTYHIEHNNFKNILVIDIKEKSRGEMRVGAHYDNSYGPEVLLKIHYNNLFLKSTIGEAKFSIAQNSRALMRYKYYPIRNRIFEFSANGYLQLTKIPDIIKDQDISFQLGHFVYTLADINGQIAIAPFRNFAVSVKYGILFSNIMLRDGVELYYDVNSVRFNYEYAKLSLILNRLNDNFFPTKGIYFNAFLKYTFNANSNRPDTSAVLHGVGTENAVLGLQFKYYILFLKHFSLIPSLSLGAMSSQAFITEKFFLGGINYSLRPNNYNLPGIKTNYISCDSYITAGLQGQYKFFKKMFLRGGIYYTYFSDYSDYEYDYENEFENNYVSSWDIGVGMQTKFGPIRMIMSKNAYKKQLFWSVNVGIPF